MSLEYTIAGGERQNDDDDDPVAIFGSSDLLEPENKDASPADLPRPPEELSREERKEQLRLASMREAAVLLGLQPGD